MGQKLACLCVAESTYYQSIIGQPISYVQKAVSAFPLTVVIHIGEVFKLIRNFIYYYINWAKRGPLASLHKPSGTRKL